MYQEIYRTLLETGKVKSAVFLNGPHMGKRCIGFGDENWLPYRDLIADTRETSVRELGDTEFLVEIYLRNPHLVILGGGHISRPVARIGKMLGFHVTVMDDREEFVTRERFPDADVLLTGAYETLSEKIPVYENTYYVTVTRGHSGDLICAGQILERPYAYFGMIGSKNKVRMTREILQKEGFSEQQLAAMHAPIGLPIGGQTPEEIAVSIMAEIIQEKNRHDVTFADEEIMNAVLSCGRGTMATIVRKTGSSPRGTGTKMFVSDSGQVYGSIGGGSIEYQVIRHASEISVPQVRRYDLSSEGAGDLGMICGGSVQILFERV